mmetsp:Transcript_120873/g.170004  ORF Transcript_120873/g.170004 Transcript_120873/m.170004 type:complete len:222 (-) Transcript_120873:204-869(-)|eukprot:s1170_g9.t1
MDLVSDYPEYLELRQYLGNFSTHRNLPCFTISKTSFGEDIGRPLPRTKTSADHLAPGHYPVDRDFPTKRRYEEVPSGWLTRSARVKQVFMPYEDRSQAFQRLLPGVKNPGPGQYEEGMSKKPIRSQEGTTPEWTLPKSQAATGRPLPRQVTAADHLGPGLYQLPNRFTELSWRKAKTLERVARTSRDTWAGPQYSQIFNRIKPQEKLGLPKAASCSNIGSK